MKVLVNLFGAPGSGKSTTAAGVFSRLKLMGVNAEYVPEVAKAMTWEGRAKSLSFQPYVFAKQMRDIERLKGQVDVVITDSPPLLSSFYATHYCLDHYPDSFHTFVMDCHTHLLQPSLNYWIRRVKPYNPAGRNQSEDEAVVLAQSMLTWLNTTGPSTLRPTTLDGDDSAIDRIVNWVRGYLRGAPVSSMARHE